MEVAQNSRFDKINNFYYFDRGLLKCSGLFKKCRCVEVKKTITSTFEHHCLDFWQGACSYHFYCLCITNMKSQRRATQRKEGQIIPFIFSAEDQTQDSVHAIIWLYPQHLNIIMKKCLDFVVSERALE